MAKPNPQTPSAKLVTARASFVRHSPRKLRLVADAVRGKTLNEAINYLKLLPQRGAKNLLAVYLQAAGNAKNNFQLSPNDLRTRSLLVEEGPRGGKKADVHAHGAKFNRGIRRKRMAHIKLELEASNGAKN